MSQIEKPSGSRAGQSAQGGSVSQLAFYISAFVVLGGGLWLLPGIVDNRRDFVFGVLLLATVSLLLATLGSLSGLAARWRQREAAEVERARSD